MGIKEIIKSNETLYRIALKTYMMRDLFITLPKVPWYIKSMHSFKVMNKKDIGLHKFNEFRLYPILRDIDATAGTVNMYLTQDLWAAQKIYKLPKEETHFDIGSRVDGFITHLLSFRGGYYIN